MPVTIQEGLQAWLERWRGLRSWGRHLEECSFKFLPHRGGPRLGTAWPCERRGVVYIRPSMPANLQTLLHELAHLAAPATEQHGD